MKILTTILVERSIRSCGESKTEPCEALTFKTSEKGRVYNSLKTTAYLGLTSIVTYGWVKGASYFSDNLDENILGFLIGTIVASGIVTAGGVIASHYLTYQHSISIDPAWKKIIARVSPRNTLDRLVTKIPYQEIKDVKVKQNWFQKFFGIANLRIEYLNDSLEKRTIYILNQEEPYKVRNKILSEVDEKN